MYFRLSLPLLLVVAGCASTDQSSTTASATPQSCEREYRVGSNIPVKDCTPAMSEAERQRVLEEMRRTIKASPAAPPSKGG